MSEYSIQLSMNWHDMNFYVHFWRGKFQIYWVTPLLLRWDASDCHHRQVLKEEIFFCLIITHNFSNGFLQHPKKGPLWEKSTCKNEEEEEEIWEISKTIKHKTCMKCDSIKCLRQEISQFEMIHNKILLY